MARIALKEQEKKKKKHAKIITCKGKKKKQLQKKKQQCLSVRFEPLRLLQRPQIATSCNYNLAIALLVIYMIWSEFW